MDSFQVERDPSDLEGDRALDSEKSGLIFEGSSESSESEESFPTVMRYRPDVDGLRAVAVISVIIYHMSP